MDDDGGDKDDTKRKTRNLSEKKRRDQFNMLVNELSTMISSNNRKMDKSTVLKSTISFLKNHNEVRVRSRAHDVQEDWKPTFLSNEEFTYLIIEALEAFVMVLSDSGQICYVSESITSLLGHNPVNIVNKSIYDLIAEEDRTNLYSLLQNPSLTVEPLQILAQENEIRFQCHMRRGTLDFREEAIYELVEFSGYFRTNMERVETDGLAGYQRDQESRMLFVCTGRLSTPQLIRDVTLVDSDRREFTSRHSLEWKFLFLDHRAPPIIGYLPFEVLGTFGYDYYHFDDLEKVVMCHEELMTKGELTSCYYRFLTKGQQWIWLQSRFYITYHQWNSKPEFVVCIHRVVSHADVAKEMKQEDTESAEVAEVVDEEMGQEQQAIKEQPVEEPPPALSPNYVADTSDVYGNAFQALPQMQPVKCSHSVSSTAGSMSSKGTTWMRVHRRYAGDSDTTSLSGDSLSSQRSSRLVTHTPTQYARDEMQESREDALNYPQTAKSHDDVLNYPQTAKSREEALNYPQTAKAHEDVLTFSQTTKTCEDSLSYPQTAKTRELTLVPQHSIGVQYLDPAPYVTSVGLPLQGMPAISLPLPIVVSPNQAHMQEHLQQKHEHLQQLIVRQQEELRQVKEQLLLARLGVLPPIIDVQGQYVQPEEVQAQRVPAQIVYEGSPGRVSLAGYPVPEPLPPHSSAATHPHLPQ